MTSILRNVGRYEILREIGRGGMATVYLARQADLDRLVALKELAPHYASDAAFATRFVAESRMAGSLSHTNIVTVYDFFEHDGVPYISMEYLERGSLRPWVGRLTLAQIAGVLEGLLAGLTHAESRGIVHRDLKPENVMVTSHGGVKITDFGIAKAVNQALTTRAFVTEPGMAIGTPMYMAPEQAMARDVGPWTDLYSAGVMAYELIVGQVPFPDADTPAAILVETVQGEGGLITASSAWLARLQAIARERGIVLIVDDIQAGCGRTGTFFSFEEAGLEPDIVCLSKSLSGIGLPFALVLLKPELDKQLPGEHSGTFRGNNLAMVGATGALSLWADPSFGEAIRRRARLLESRLGETAQAYASHGCAVRGRGLMRGLVWNDRTVAPRVSRAAFKLRLLVETSGAHGHVLKIMPPLTIPDDELLRGLDILDAALGEVFSTKPS